MGTPAPSSSSRRRSSIISEDTVLYSIYPSYSTDLHSLRSQIHDVLFPLLQDYIWQHDPFQLAVSLPTTSAPSSASMCHLCSSSNVPHLHGKTRYGDNVEDEWFVVFLLYEASRKFPSLSIRVWDNDGEFLLIESAYLLPRWLNPDNSANRVFIRKGELHILGKDLFPLKSNFGLVDALRVLEKEGVDTRASDGVQSVLHRRISAYPERARTNMHRARVRVPLPVAQVLRHEPCLIALAVEGFYDRDIDSMKYAAKMEKFLRSDGGGVDIVHVSVKMSRAMYAQLVQQNFQAPKYYPMPSRDEGQVVFREAELGMKIACGFEMMYQDRRQAGEGGKGSTWDAFKESLESSGYFRDLLSGSEEYKRLWRVAKENHKNSSLFVSVSDIFNSPVRRIDEILSLSHSISDFEGIEVPLSDDDYWLYDGEADLNSALLERQKEIELYDSKIEKTSGQQRPFDKINANIPYDDMAKALEEFVGKISSFEGAEIPKSRDLEEVDFDVNYFIKACDVDENSQSDIDDNLDGCIFSSSSSSEVDYEIPDAHELRDFAESVEGEVSSGDRFMESYAAAMQKELRATTLEKSFIHKQGISDSGEGTSNAMDICDDMAAIDVDKNLVKNLLDSYSSQQGLPGPASNLLGSLGLKLPDDKKGLKKQPK